MFTSVSRPSERYWKHPNYFVRPQRIKTFSVGTMPRSKRQSVLSPISKIPSVSFRLARCSSLIFHDLEKVHGRTVHLQLCNNFRWVAEIAFPSTAILEATNTTRKINGILTTIVNPPPT